MTREEAIKKLKIIREDYWDEYNDPMPALDMAIKALEQEPCEDCISRDSAIKAMDYDIKSFEFKSGVSRYMDDIAKLLNTIYEIQVNNIKALPSVIPQEIKTGHWIKPKGKVKPFGDDTIQCDMCGFFTDVDCNYNYCPNCGCRMVEPQESEK